MYKRPDDKLWWGYIDWNEKIHIKRYTDDRAVRNAQESGTAIGIFDPFFARTIEEASYMMIDKWREERVFMKKGITE